MSLDAVAVENLCALVLGLAFAGLLSAAFECAMQRPASLALMQQSGRTALLSVPILAFSAPFIILRAALRRRRFERPRIGPVLGATVLAGLWGLAAGHVLLRLAAQLAAT